MTVTINAVTSTGLVQTSDGSGVIKLQSNGVTTNALAWVNFNGTGTVAIRSSYNVSSITDNGTGDYTVNFTTALSDANYACIATAGNSTGATTNTQLTAKQTGTKTTSACQVMFQQGAGGVDLDQNAVAFFGN